MIAWRARMPTNDLLSNAVVRASNKFELVWNVMGLILLWNSEFFCVLLSTHIILYTILLFIVCFAEQGQTMRPNRDFLKH